MDKTQSMQRKHAGGRGKQAHPALGRQGGVERIEKVEGGGLATKVNPGKKEVLGLSNTEMVGI